MNEEMRSRHLAQTERHIDQTLAHIARQRQLLSKLQGAGREIDIAEGLLKQLERTLELELEHREIILAG